MTRIQSSSAIRAGWRRFLLRSAGWAVALGSTHNARATDDAPPSSAAQPTQDPVRLDNVEYRARVGGKGSTDGVTKKETQESSVDQRTDSVDGQAATPSSRIDALAVLHLAEGVGAGIDWRLGVFGVRSLVAYNPLRFIVDDDTNDTKLGKFRIQHSVQLGVDAPLLFGSSEIGFSLGYRYNTTLGHGGAAAFQAMFELGQQRFGFWVPLMYFPKGNERARRDLSVPSGHSLNHPLGANVISGIGAAWAFW